MENNKKRNRVVGGSGRNTTTGGGDSRDVVDGVNGVGGSGREDVTRPIPSEEPIIMNRSDNNNTIKVKTSSEEVGRVNQKPKITKNLKRKNSGGGGGGGGGDRGNGRRVVAATNLITSTTAAAAVRSAGGGVPARSSTGGGVPNSSTIVAPARSAGGGVPDSSSTGGSVPDSSTIALARSNILAPARSSTGGGVPASSSTIVPPARSAGGVPGYFSVSGSDDTDDDDGDACKFLVPENNNGICGINYRLVNGYCLGHRGGTINKCKSSHMDCKRLQWYPSNGYCRYHVNDRMLKPHCIYTDDIIKKCKCTYGLSTMSTKINNYCYNHKGGIINHCKGGNNEIPCRLSIENKDGYCKTHARELREIKKLSKDHVRQISIEIENNSDDDDDETL